jgi:DNA-binding response OmpR family regulator
MKERKRILIADDDPEVVRMLTLELDPSRYEIISAASGRETLLKVSREDPDLVVLDYQMPEGDGLYVMTKLKTALETFTIPVIILTAYDSNELRRQTSRLSACSYLTKPAAPGVLLEKIKTMLA